MVVAHLTDYLYSGMGVFGVTLLVALRIMFKNGIFCYTPCGAHACIVDTNEGGANLEKTIKHIANDHYERELKKVHKLKTSFVELDANDSVELDVSRRVNEKFKRKSMKFVELFSSKHTDKDTDRDSLFIDTEDGKMSPVQSKR